MGWGFLRDDMYSSQTYHVLGDTERLLARLISCQALLHFKTKSSTRAHAMWQKAARVQYSVLYRKRSRQSPYDKEAYVVYILRDEDSCAWLFILWSDETGALPPLPAAQVCCKNPGKCPARKWTVAEQQGQLVLDTYVAKQEAKLNAIILNNQSPRKIDQKEKHEMKW